MSETQELPPVVQKLIPIGAGIVSFVALTTVGVVALEQPLIGATAGLFTGVGAYHNVSFIFGQRTAEQGGGTQPDPQVAAAATAIEPVGIIMFAMYFVTEEVTQTLLYTAAASIVAVPVFFFVTRWMFQEMASAE
jgi:hypothetical protein